jgi:hypothetical protein
MTSMSLARRPARAIAEPLMLVALSLATLSAAAGLVVPHLYRDTEAWVRQARAADLVTLFVVAPALAIALSRVRTGSLSARLVALAATGYLVYNYAIFGFAVAINPMTPVHLAALGCAGWALAANLAATLGAPAEHLASVRPPPRVSGVFLILVAVLFGLMWAAQISDAIANGNGGEIAKLGLVTNPVYALDLAFALPALVVAGVASLRRRPVAGNVAYAALAWVVFMGLGVLAIFVFDGAAGVPVPMPATVLVAVLTALALALVLTAKRTASPKSSLDERPYDPGHRSRTFGPPGRLADHHPNLH